MHRVAPHKPPSGTWTISTVKVLWCTACLALCFTAGVAAGVYAVSRTHAATDPVRYLPQSRFQGAQPFRNAVSTVGNPTVIAENEWLRLESHRVRAGGAVIDDWWWVQVPDHINVVPSLTAATARQLLQSDGSDRTPSPTLRTLRPSAAARAQLATDDASPLYILLRQTKYGFSSGGESWAVVGGLRNDTTDGIDNLLATAKRELLEELGLVSEHWVDFGDRRVDANRGCGTMGAFLALNAVPAAIDAATAAVNSTGADLERQVAHLVTLNDLRAAVETPGAVLELKWTYTMLRSWAYMTSHAKDTA